MSRKNILIVFVKNTVKGKVKTRLAADIGNDKALKVYEHLLKLTFETIKGLKVTKQIWYSDFIESDDIWQNSEFEKFLQKGDNLGDRMKHAVEQAFLIGAQKVIIIGSDCSDLNENHINRALNNLNESDAVIGPSKDGGYYLLGLKAFRPELFYDIEWSTDQVANQTREVLQSYNLNWGELEELNDIDTIEDLESSNIQKFDQ